MLSNETGIWHNVLDDLARTTDTDSVRSWLEQVQVVSCSSSELVIEAVDQVDAGYLANIEASFRRVCGFKPSVDVQRDASSNTVRIRYILEQTTSRDVPLLDQEFTFENYVSGSGNRLAHAAAMAVSAVPGEVYNPLVVEGDRGQGKTHLLHALCHRTLRLNPNVQIFSTTGDQLATELLQAKTDPDLRGRLENADFLVVDDIHRFATSPEADVAFQHWFDRLIHRGAQIVVASASPLEKLTLGEHPRSRLTAGLVVALVGPDPTMRGALIRNRAVRSGISIPQEVVSSLAERSSGTCRSIQSLTLKLIGYSTVMHRPIDLQLADEVVAITRSSVALPAPVQLSDIAREVCTAWRVTQEELESRSRARSIALPRQVAMYLSRVLTKHSLEEIGDFYGGRDHSTVKHAYDKIRRHIVSDADLNRLVKTLRKRLLDG